ncbi:MULTISPECIES: DUF3861 domain-containing protein [unclassified Rubrivivax]|uniref:DUF3861 domain-containing protein n=1 Tax=unclassified Rubrivivax TaxID=2649762 RepID=UPI001E53E654|nr:MULTISPECIES: DUF3861 domain-containing protein [unclassified Rubrivivax]MCC9596143.1 DUF3861 domain-containing protein [Rubrivivax sp. JA1055]MCC9647515.1 DUF3861 domain-containing protein [Rubrivivax sp. JA1029]
MRQHRYRITVEHLADADGNLPGNTAPLVFEAGSHDNILQIVERLRGHPGLPPESAPAFGVGLKLFGEVMLENRKSPLFVDFSPHFRDFMQALKSGARSA